MRTDAMPLQDRPYFFFRPLMNRTPLPYHALSVARLVRLCYLILRPCGAFLSTLSCDEDCSLAVESRLIGDGHRTDIDF